MRNRAHAIFADFERNFLKPLEQTRLPIINVGGYMPHAGLLATDIVETPAAYEYHINTPGFKKEEITVNVVNGILTVSLKKENTVIQENPQAPEVAEASNSTTATGSVEPLETTTPEATTEKVQAPTNRMLYNERSLLSVQRSYKLFDKADFSKIEANYDHGTLVLTIAKLVPNAPQSTRVEIR